MTDAGDVKAAVRRAWETVPAPPAGDLRLMAWASGEDAWRAFVNKSPVDVDIAAPAFLGCTPLEDLPPRAAAAYLGTYLLSLLEGMQDQADSGLFYDILTRAHVLACLSDEDFWERVIRPHLPEACRTALVALTLYLEARRDLLGVAREQVETMVRLARDRGTRARA